MQKSARSAINLRLRFAIAFILCLILVVSFGTRSLASDRPLALRGALPDISGLSWINDDTFLAVSDAKNTNANTQPRISLIRLPRSARGVSWRFLDLDWQAVEGLSHDLESIARILDTDLFLLCESGSFKLKKARIFLAQYQKNKLRLLGFTYFPTKVKNIEGTAIAQVGKESIFLYAERAPGKAQTTIHLAKISLPPLKIETLNEVTFPSPVATTKNFRIISAMEVDRANQLYIASASDLGNDGPFQSIVWQIGKIETENAEPRLILAEKPERIATLDGFKVEGIAIRDREIFIATDDEYYGGVIRPLTTQN
jgi:hypothetical protein